jgi:molecular chaperone GrpE
MSPEFEGGSFAMAEMKDTDDDRASVRVEDRRHWARQTEDEAETQEEATPPTQPTLVDELRRRAEAAERRLQEYIEAFKGAQAEHEASRQRLLRDVDRRAALKFGELVRDLLGFLDDLDLALLHANGVAEAQPLAEGVGMARERLLGALAKQGVERLELEGEPFDPNLAEAVRVAEVDDPELDGRVVETVRQGFKLGDLVLREARVVVGKLAR